MKQRMIIFCLFLLVKTQAQTSFIENFYQSGKIYVVFLIVFIIFVGILAYLLRLDRRLTSLEKKYKP